MTKKTFTFILIISLILVIGFFIFPSNKEQKNYFNNPPALTPTNSPVKIVEKPTIVWFLGDIMLDRGVEKKIKENNKTYFYPFEKIYKSFDNANFVVANLEGAIVNNPPDFGLNSLKFAFPKDSAKYLKLSGINIVSLANNHSLNMRRNGLKETKKILKENSIDFVGDPITCDNNYILEKEKFVILAFNKTFTELNCSNKEIAKAVEKARHLHPNKLLVVFIHWGIEYKPNNSSAQKDLARQMIDSGADLIIGTHPHVIQNIEEYKGKLIFYSLGNFIFDMTAFEEVKEGLAVKLEIFSDKLFFSLLPVRIENGQAFPAPEKEKILENLSKNSSNALKDSILTGKIEILKEKHPEEKGKTEDKESTPKYDKEEIIDSSLRYGPFKTFEGQKVSHIFDILNIPSPKAVAFSPDGREVWVTSLLNKKRGVAVFDAKNGKLKNNINLDNGGGVEITFSKNGEKAYVSQMETAKIYEISTDTKKILRIFNTDSTWTKVLAFSPDYKKLYASNWVGNNVSEIDLKTGKLNRLIKTVKTPRGIYITKNNYLYIAGFANGEIEKINLLSLERKVLLKTGGAMRHIAADEENGFLYFSDMGSNKIFKLNLKNDEINLFAKTDINPNTIVLSPDKKILAVSCRGKNYSAANYYIPGPEWGTILLFNTENGELIDAIIGGNQPTGLDISPGEKFLAFSDFLDNKIEVWRMPEKKETTIPSRFSGIYKKYIQKK